MKTIASSLVTAFTLSTMFIAGMPQKPSRPLIGKQAIAERKTFVPLPPLELPHTISTNV